LDLRGLASYKGREGRKDGMERQGRGRREERGVGERGVGEDASWR